jgi:hypothetical protein
MKENPFCCPVCGNGNGSIFFSAGALMRVPIQDGAPRVPNGIGLDREVTLAGSDRLAAFSDQTGEFRISVMVEDTIDIRLDCPQCKCISKLSEGIHLECKDAESDSASQEK